MLPLLWLWFVHSMCKPLNSWTNLEYLEFLHDLLAVIILHSNSPITQCNKSVHWIGIFRPEEQSLCILPWRLIRLHKYLFFQRKICVRSCNITLFCKIIKLEKCMKLCRSKTIEKCEVLHKALNFWTKQHRQLPKAWQ